MTRRSSRRRSGNVISINGDSEFLSLAEGLRDLDDGLTLAQFWDMLDRWQEHMIARGLVASTRENYDSFLIKLYRRTRTAPTTLTEREFAVYLAAINPRGPAAHMTARAARSFYRFATRRSIVAANPVEDVVLKPPKYLPAQSFTAAEVRGIVAAALARSRRRAWAMVLLFETGARIGSLAGVRECDTGTHAREEIRFVIAKGDRPYSWWLSPLAAQAVRELLALRSCSPDDWRHDTLIGVHKVTLGQWFHEAAVDAGLPPGKRNAHKARSTAATELYRRTHDDRLVQQMLNHSNRATISRYTATVDEEAVNAMSIAASYFDLSDILEGGT